MSQKTIAVTGASGYIGGILLERLAESGEWDKIIALDVVRPNNMPEGAVYIPCDVRDPGIAKKIEGASVVVHLAFIVAAIHDVKKTYDINVNGSRNLLAACERAGIEKLVAASSVAAYGLQPDKNAVIDEDTPLRGDSCSYYMHTKRLVEEHLDDFEKRNPDVVLTRLRPSILMGRKTNNFAREFGNFPIIPVVAEGFFLPVVHEDDVADAFMLAIERDAPGPFIIALPEPLSLAGLARRFGKPTFTVSFDTVMAVSKILYPLRLTKLSPDWVVSAKNTWRFDISKAKEILGWEPKRDLDKTVADMMSNINENTMGRKIFLKLTDK